MKTIEEKARAYDRAKDIMEKYLKSGNAGVIAENTIKNAFPELHENGDEIVKEELINYLKHRCNTTTLSGEERACNKWIDWLEKQGQKPAEKAETKFHIGDWVIWDNKIICYIDNIYQGKESLMYTITDTNNMIRSYSVKSFDNNARHWTIQDAKDGDVLFAENFDNIGGCVFLFKGLDSWKFDAEGDRAIATGYCGTSITESGNTDFGIQGPDCVEIKRVHPATKEQRDLLFQKMKEAGYTFDFESKELKKIHMIDEGKAEMDYCFTKMMNGEKVIPDCSKELKKIVVPIFHIGDRVRYKGHSCNGIITEITNTDYICGNAKLPISTQDKLELVEQKPAEWKQENVEELSDFENAMMHIGGSFFGENAGLDPNDTATIKEQAELLLELAPKIGWSKEDENCLSTIITEFSKCAGKSVSKDKWMCCNDFLNSLRDRVQSKQEWTKEDEKRFKSCLNILQPKTLLGNIETINTKWFKSLKDRYTWKPTDGQIKALKEACDKSWEPDGLDPLYTLYEDLKKLKGE